MATPVERDLKRACVDQVVAAPFFRVAKPSHALVNQKTNETPDLSGVSSVLRGWCSKPRHSD